MTKIFLGISGILIVLLLVAFGVIRWQHGKIEDLNRDIATEKANVSTLKGSVKDLNDTIDLMDKQRADDQAKILKLGNELNDAKVKRDEAFNKLNAVRSGLRDRAIKNPSVLSDRATSATERVFLDFERVTTSDGRKANEADRKVSPGASKRREKAGDDKGRSPDAGRDGRSEPASPGR